MHRWQLEEGGPQANWPPQVKGRVERLIKLHFHGNQRTQLCRTLDLSTETLSKHIAAELERRGDVTAVVQLPKLDRKTILGFFRDVAEGEHLSEGALRDARSEELRVHLESLLLEVRNLSRAPSC